MGNGLNGLDLHGAGCSNDSPNYKSSITNPFGNLKSVEWRQSWSNFGDFDFEDALRDPTWTKGAFLRDPVERLVSAFQSKCSPPEECDGCPFGHLPRFEDVIEKLDSTGNKHFIPQSSLCGGLGHSIGNYSHVGLISNNRTEVVRQVGTLMESAIERTGDLSAERADAIRNEIDVWFPLVANASDPHFHPGTDIHDFFDDLYATENFHRHHALHQELLRSPAMLQKVVDYYNMDYEYFSMWLHRPELLLTKG